MNLANLLQEKVLDAFINSCNRVQNHVDEVCFSSTPFFNLSNVGASSECKSVFLVGISIKQRK